MLIITIDISINLLKKNNQTQLLSIQIKLANIIQNGSQKRIQLRPNFTVIEKSQLPSSLQINFKVSWDMVNKKSEAVSSFLLIDYIKRLFFM